RSLAPAQVKTVMEVKTPQKIIRRVELLYAGDQNEVLDDLEFDGAPPTDLPKEPPKIGITDPEPAARQTTNTTIIVEGNVVGPGVGSTAVLKVHVPRPPGSTTTADFTVPLTLVQLGTTNTHRFTQSVTLSGVGPQTLTVEAENSGGFRGQASIVVDSMPAALRARFQAEGGAANLGNFAFGSAVNIGSCIYAVYASGGIALAGPKSFVVRGASFTKWLALQDQGRFPQLGCPASEVRTVAFNGTAQDFAGGRIYASPAGTFFVPPVFTNAIDILGGESGVGLPVADPTSDSRTTYLTWLFQRFRRDGIPLPSTLEIRGNPPKLTVERQAGDGSLFQGILTPANATIVESFNCSQTSGPCSVAAPPDEPLRSDTATFCHNSEFNWADLVAGVFANRDPDPPEWVPIVGHYAQTPIWGALFDVHLASGDNPFAHHSRFEPCPTPTLEALVNETICPSDWDLKIRPLPGFRSLQPVGRDAVQIEFERVDAQAHLVGYGDPTPGELVFVSGRYIVDCGHGPKFKTEIHPPSVYTTVRSTTLNGRPATEADIWVNRFFSGGSAPTDAIDFDIYPPPRPTPQALLGASTPGNQSGAVSVTFTPMAPFGPVRVHVTATPGKPEVTKYGEMKMRKDDTAFGFDGRLRVYWSCPNGAC
ncbi:MAG: LGFP repeat-containing protein, partial [Candidatus Udaeobacter sp.]